MRLAWVPDWLVYLAVLLVLIFVARGQLEHADAPQPPPPVTGEATTLLSPLSPFNGAKILKIAPDARGRYASAFSIGDAGVWLTAASAVKDCAQLAVIIAPGRGAQARSRPAPSAGLAILTTEGGGAALPMADVPAKPGDEGFIPGFPQGATGEVAVRLLGARELVDHHRDDRAQAVLAWTEIGRTDGVKGLLTGLEGAPVLDGMGRLQGVLLSEAPRRGRLYSAPISAVRQAMAAARTTPGGQAEGDGIGGDNYGRAADALRRDLRVTQVWCGR